MMRASGWPFGIAGSSDSGSEPVIYRTVLSLGALVCPKNWLFAEDEQPAAMNDDAAKASAIQKLFKRVPFIDTLRVVVEAKPVGVGLKESKQLTDNKQVNTIRQV